MGFNLWRRRRRTANLSRRALINYTDFCKLDICACVFCNQRADFDLSMVESEPPGKRRKLKLSLSRSRPIAATACHDGKLRDAGPQQFPAATEDNVSRTTATGGGEVDAESDSKKRPREENGSERTVVKVHNDAKKTTGGESDDEAYFSANFKAVCCSVLSEDCPESHVFTEDEKSTVERFMSLSGGFRFHLKYCRCVVIWLV